MRNRQNRSGKLDDPTNAGGDATAPSSPAFALFGEGRIFPDVLHCEAITDRAPRHGWKIARHRHPDLHQFFHVATGHVTLRLADGDRVLTPPVALSVPAQLVHGFTFERGTEGHVVTVPVAVLAALAGQGLDRLAVTVPTPRVTALFAAIASRHADADGLRDLALRALVLALGCDLAADAPPGHDAAAQLFARFTALVREHAVQGWGVAEYARHLGTSATQLNRVVRTQADLSVMGAVRAHLLGEAARRLAYTRQPVTAIAYDLGFSDPAYFARVFAKGMGVSPRGYRQRFG
ncbi:helix-turn-helix domain-containing protein [Loktanella fryxellensis]|uniref:helix-turn-helix domain-containing protein n=1 Tax=Loktanella fryxellensis TaxID=245187 RepID=UPI0015A6C091|nr:helix-turn-helix domain-containing protein [Loktanella fryxellensis]